jgi:hypothetical protein
MPSLLLSMLLGLVLVGDPHATATDRDRRR